MNSSPDERMMVWRALTDEGKEGRGEGRSTGLRPVGRGSVSTRVAGEASGTSGRMARGRIPGLVVDGDVRYRMAHGSRTRATAWPRGKLRRVLSTGDQGPITREQVERGVLTLLAEKPDQEPAAESD